MWQYICVLLALAGTVNGLGAGRAIPIRTENYIIERFRKINPQLEYDFTNFLVDLSGLYANCKFIGTKQLKELTDFEYIDGSSIALAQDFTYGTEPYVEHVDGYLQPAFENWVMDFDSIFREQIMHAKRFGCSVRPACNNQVSFACLFTPALTQRDFPPTYPPTTTTSTTTTTTYNPIPFYKPQAKAFTKMQYDDAERTTGQAWDRSHYLENLSGIETDCDMIEYYNSGKPWPFTKAREIAKNIEGRIGVEENTGSTPVALLKILKEIIPVNNSRKVGCSLIADCPRGSRIYVVVSCIFRINKRNEGFLNRLK